MMIWGILGVEKPIDMGNMGNNTQIIWPILKCSKFNTQYGMIFCLLWVKFHFKNGCWNLTPTPSGQAAEQQQKVLQEPVWNVVDFSMWHLQYFNLPTWVKMGCIHNGAGKAEKLWTNPRSPNWKCLVFDEPLYQVEHATRCIWKLLKQLETAPTLSFFIDMSWLRQSKSSEHLKIIYIYIHLLNIIYTY